MPDFEDPTLQVSERSDLINAEVSGICNSRENGNPDPRRAEAIYQRRIIPSFIIGQDKRKMKGGKNKQ